MAKQKKKSNTHTGQTKVVSAVKSKPTTPEERLKKLYEESMKHPASAILKSVLEDNWKKIEKDFKQWANDYIDGSLCYYSDNQIREILMFFKKRFVR